MDSETLYDMCERARDQDTSEFFAILSDADSHNYLEGEQYWPDTWQMLRDCLKTESVQAAMAADVQVHQFAADLLVYGIVHGYDEWTYKEVAS